MTMMVYGIYIIELTAKELYRLGMLKWEQEGRESEIDRNDI